MNKPEKRYNYFFYGLIMAVAVEFGKFMSGNSIEEIGTIYGEFIACWLIFSCIMRFIAPRIENAAYGKKAVIVLVALIFIIPAFLYIAQPTR